MRRILVALVPLAACTGEANHLGNPFTLPSSGIANSIDNAAYNERRGQVEVFVKTNHPALISEIAIGGGPLLNEAFELARVPASDRPARRIQLQSDVSLYKTAPGSLVTALMVYGN